MSVGSRLVGGDPASVQVATVGLTHWTTSVAADWLAGVEEQDFCRAASEAASELMRSFTYQARKLKVSIYST
ncbi:MAG: hypothetical protein WKF79_07225 [Nocardioides sp.]